MISRDLFGNRIKILFLPYISSAQFDKNAFSIFSVSGFSLDPGNTVMDNTCLNNFTSHPALHNNSPSFSNSWKDDSIGR